MVSYQFRSLHLGSFRAVVKADRKEVCFEMDAEARLISVGVTDKGDLYCVIFYPIYTGGAEEYKKQYNTVRIGLIKDGENIYDKFNLGHDDDIIYLNFIGGHHVILISDKEKGLIHGR